MSDMTPTPPTAKALAEQAKQLAEKADAHRSFPRKHETSADRDLARMTPMQRARVMGYAHEMVDGVHKRFEENKQ